MARSGSTRVADLADSGDQAKRLRSRFRGAFLGCLLGDAVGRPFEMMSAGGGGVGARLDAMLARTGPWSSSDDTEMMISVAESLMRTGGVLRDDLLATLAANYD